MSGTVTARVCEAERHLAEVTCLLLHQGKLYSGADDGKIKVWSPDLKLIHQIDAHPVNLYSLAASDHTLYSCSNDGTIKGWSLNSFELEKNLFESPTDEVMRLIFCDGKLYSGDDKGSVIVWENDVQVGKYEVGEEVWDLLVSGNCLITVRNLDVSVIEMKQGGKQFTFLQSYQGRSPLRKAGQYFCVMDREGREINVHELSKESKFKNISKIKAHDMIVNALSCVDNPAPTIFSGGYDKVVKRWNVPSLQCTGSLELETVVNALQAGPTGTSVYVAGAIGYLSRIEFT